MFEQKVIQNVPSDHKMLSLLFWDYPLIYYYISNIVDKMGTPLIIYFGVNVPDLMDILETAVLAK